MRAGRSRSLNRSVALFLDALAVAVVAHIPSAALEHKGRLGNDPGRRRAALGARFLSVRVRGLDPFFKQMLTLGALIFVNRHD